MKQTKKVIILLILLYIFNITGVFFSIKNASYRYTLERMISEYKDSAKNLCELWTSNAGGNFYMQDDIIYTAKGEKLTTACKTWFEKWASDKSKDDECSIIIYDGEGYKRLYTSLIDSTGLSMQGTYIDNDELIKLFDTNTSFSDYTGELKIGGKYYMVSYSLLYQKDINTSPFICFLAENLDQVEEKIVEKTFRHLPIILLLTALEFGIFYVLFNKTVKKVIEYRIKEATSTLSDASRSIISNQDMLKATEQAYEKKNQELRDALKELLEIVHSKNISSSSLSEDAKELHELLDKSLNDCQTGRKDINRLINNQTNLIGELNILIDKVNNNQIDNETLKLIIPNLIDEMNSFLSIENKIKILPTKLIDDISYSKTFVDNFNNFNDKNNTAIYDTNQKLNYIEDKINDSHLLEKPRISYSGNLELQLNNVDSAINNLKNI